MMAFFLLMWLAQYDVPGEKGRARHVFQALQLFEKGGKSFMHEGDTRPSGKLRGRGVIETGEHSTGITNDEMASKLLTASIRASNRKRSGLHRGHGGGDTNSDRGFSENSIFAVGSAQLTDSAKGIINSVAAVLRIFPMKSRWKDIPILRR